MEKLRPRLFLFFFFFFCLRLVDLLLWSFWWIATSTRHTLRVGSFFYPYFSCAKRKAAFFFLNAFLLFLSSFFIVPRHSGGWNRRFYHFVCPTAFLFFFLCVYVICSCACVPLSLFVLRFRGVSLHSNRCSFFSFWFSSHFFFLFFLVYNRKLKRRCWAPSVDNRLSCNPTNELLKGVGWRRFGIKKKKEKEERETQLILLVRLLYFFFLPCCPKDL